MVQILKEFVLKNFRDVELFEFVGDTDMSHEGWTAERYSYFYSVYFEKRTGIFWEIFCSERKVFVTGIDVDWSKYKLVPKYEYLKNGI